MIKHRAIKEQVLSQRKDGLSLTQLCQKHPTISRRTLYEWIKTIPWSGKRDPELVQKLAAGNKKRFNLARQEARNLGRQYARDHLTDLEFISVCALYWAEGGKQRNSFSFSNCDPQMHFLVRKVVSKIFPQYLGDIKMYIQVYDEQQLQDAKIFWSSLFGREVEFAYIHFVPKKSSYAKWPNGVLGQRIYRTDLVQFFLGAISELYQVDETQWK